jgi:hypothetical protein
VEQCFGMLLEGTTSMENRRMWPIEEQMNDHKRARPSSEDPEVQEAEVDTCCCLNGVTTAKESERCFLFQGSSLIRACCC